MRGIGVLTAIGSVVLFIFGVIGDGRGWWTDRGWGQSRFLANTLTSAVGFLLGVPVARFFISAITDAREERALRTRVKRLTAASWDGFATAVASTCADGISRTLVDEAKNISDDYSLLMAQLRAWLAPRANTLVNQSLGHASTQAALVKAADNIEASLERLNNTVESALSLQSSWASLRGRWKLLDDYVRVQRLESGLQWFSDVYDSWFQKYLASYESPLTKFNAFRDYVHNRPVGLSGTWQAWVRHCFAVIYQPTMHR